MAKVAYLFGVSEYESWLPALPAAVKDVDAMELVLRDPKIGGFDEVKAFRNLSAAQISNEMVKLFTNRSKDDLILMYFAGHGKVTEMGQFYFMAKNTEENQQTSFNKANAIVASYVHDLMVDCYSQRIVVILDCCQSGAFGKAIPRGIGKIDFASQLGGQGRIILTASDEANYTFEQEGEELAIYTRYLVQGLKTGAADRDKDGWVSVNELHDYVVEELKMADLRMSPQRYVKGDGEKIKLAKAVIDPDLEYRKLVKQYCKTGDILPAGRQILDQARDRLAPLGLTVQRAEALETEELGPHRRLRKKNQDIYRKTLRDILALDRTSQSRAFAEIRELEEHLNLLIEDIEIIRLEVLGSKTFPKIEPKPVPSPSPTVQPKPTIIAQPVESSPIPQPEPKTIPLPHPPKSQAISQPVSIPLPTKPRVRPIDRSPKITSPKIKRRKLLQYAGWGGAGFFGVSSITLLVQILRLSVDRTEPAVTSGKETLKFSEIPLDPVKETAKTSLGLPKQTFEVITLDPKGQPAQRKQYEVEILTQDLGNGVGLKMVAIPAGRFMMGSPENEKNRGDGEGPQHEVKVPAFFMGQTQVTQGQWRAVAKLPKVKRDLSLDPSNLKGDNRPVETISWDDAIEFCDRLSAKTGMRYGLPSEAQWEYACRAGTKTPFHFGETISTDVANYAGDYTYGQGKKGDDRQETMVVGRFPPNSFGLHDMHGNVWEWCADPEHDSYKNAPIDGSIWKTDPPNEFNRLVRGGSWEREPSLCRSASRGASNRGNRLGTQGFRLIFPSPHDA
jgi:formylglycine-generating enzyme required for sulfatase activity